jgi:hypothetical protein
MTWCNYNTSRTYLSITTHVLIHRGSKERSHRRGRDRMVVRFTTTYAINTYHN